MSIINLLSDDTINKIAAGEVVERPLSVVKELTENAIDAGSSAVTIEIKEGGINYIRITDNGCGIGKDDIRTAFLRHATSKIKDADDLVSVASLGFRGEALASISAVAKCELITRTSDSIIGYHYVIEGGNEVKLEEIGSPEGTTFIIRDLFYNVPARKKFLKSATTEGGYVVDAVYKLALSHPSVSFHLIVNGQVKLHTSGNSNKRDVIYAIYGKDTARELLEADYEGAGYEVKGFIGKPALSRGNRSYELFEVNGRTIQSKLLSRATEEAYHTFVMQHKYPVVFLSIKVPFEAIDANVHPAKLEVRFKDEETVYEVIKNAISRALNGGELIREDISEAATEAQESKVAEAGNGAGARLPRQKAALPFEINRRMEEQEAEVEGTWQESEGEYETEAVSELESKAVAEATGSDATSYVTSENSYGVTSHVTSGVSENVTYNVANSFEQENEINPETTFESVTPGVTKPASTQETFTQLELPEAKILSEKSKPEFKLIGSLFDTYLLIEYKDDFLMLDQHAAHEKVMYETFMKGFREHSMTSQALNPPIILTLTEREHTVLFDNIDRFSELGYEIESFGGRDVAVYGVPGNIYSIAKEELLIEMLDDLADETGHGGSTIISDKIAMMSCKAAVKGNMRLDTSEQLALIEQLLSLDQPYTCPHGRPTAIKLSKTEIEKKFKRIV